MGPLPFVAPGEVVGSHESQQKFEYTFPDVGNDYHQSTLQWTDASGQQAETSTSLATTKPSLIEYETRPEVSDFFYPAEDHALY